MKKVGDRNEVQDDFELICFDLVSSPSTPGAYLFLNKEDKNKYEENLEEEKKSPENITKNDKSVDLMRSFGPPPRGPKHDGPPPTKDGERPGKPHKKSLTK